MGFFLKYAFDNNWITETMRVVIGVVIGAGLVLMASWAHRKGLEVFSQGLVGAGISVLYLSVYASFSYYHLVPQVVAFLVKVYAKQDELTKARAAGTGPDVLDVVSPILLG